MYYLLGICLALAALLVMNALISVATTMLWRVIEQPAHRWSSAARARLLFALRIVPPIGSLVCVMTLLLPAYIAHEPQDSAETVSVKLALLALLSISGIALALWRGLATWRATRRLAADWMLHAEPIQLHGISIPAYKLKHSFPVIAIVGVVRPRLFVATHLIEQLEAEELSAAVLHEKAHLAARDNFKRALMRACGDMLAVVPCGRTLERLWKEASEAAADEYAARVGGSAFALSLAAALIKLARLIPESAKPTLPAGAFLFGEAGTSLESRVQRLTRLAERRTPRHPNVAPAASLIRYFLLCCCCALLAVLITQTHILMTIHDAIERVVAALQ